MREAGADVAAAELLALYADPVRHRPRLTQGREPLPGAIHAFRFAQGRFPQAGVSELIDRERGRLLEAAVFFIRQVCLREGATHYQVLGVSPESPRQAITEHYRALMALLHPDRQDANSERWPATAAPRVNQAYAVLSDDALRREYDAGLRKAVNTTRDPVSLEPESVRAASVRVPVRATGAAARTRYGRRILIGSAALASLFFLNVWWASIVPSEYETLLSATPMERSWRWMRDVLPPNHLPSFLGSGVPSTTSVQPAQEPAKRSDPLSPLIRVRQEPVTAPAETKAEPVLLAEATPAPRQETRAADPKVAPRSPPVVAQAPVKTQVPPPTPATDAQIAELEVLVANLVSHYEAGELDRLVALFDTGSLGVFEAMGVRQDFEDFFRATKERQLRLQAISWEAAKETARVRGNALLRATYGDQPSPVERVVALDMTLFWRDGRPRIARLSLFPHE